MHQAQWSPERPLPPPVSLASQSHHEKPPEVTCTSRGTQGFLPQPGKALERPSSTRLEARFPYHGSGAMTRSPPPLENNPEIPPSSRDEGLRLLHGLATNLATSLQTPQEA